MSFFLTRVNTLLYKECMSPKLYNTKQAAKEVGITRATLQEWIRRGTVQAPKLQVRDGRAVRLWTISDVAKLKSVKVPMGRPKKRA
jgi:excisionase family DNA binding protein